MEGTIGDGIKKCRLLRVDASTQCNAKQIHNTTSEEIKDIKASPNQALLECSKNNNKENSNEEYSRNGDKDIAEKEKEKSKIDRISSKRKRRTASLSPVCPVCGLTLRAGELKEHYEKEVKLLQDLNDPSAKSSIRRQKRLSGKKGKNHANGKDSSENEIERQQQAIIERSEKRQGQLLSVKYSQRLRKAKMLISTATHIVQPEESSSEYHMISCPICDAPIAGNDDELTSHVERCLFKREGGVDEEDSEEESVEEYTWAGQTRIRATTLLEGGLMACGGAPVKLQMTNEDEELDIDGDAQIEYGLPQYTERDVIPCTTDIPSDVDAQDCIRAAISIDQSSSNSKETSRSRWSSENGESLTEEDDRHQIGLHEIKRNEDPTIAIKDLKLKLANMADELQKEKLKCLICMEGFNTPLVSIICWHVYCEECWLRTLGAKKLCPQCNTITSPGDLRRIYV